jgi:glycosyltransferase involved in cell wall biosynthesis
MRTARRAQRVITVSEFSKREIMELYGIPAERIHVIYNGVSCAFWEQGRSAGHGMLERFGLQSEPYILFVGGADPRKNHKTVVEAFVRRRESLKPCRLVLVGDPIHRYGNYHETIKSAGLEGEILVVGRLDAAALRGLYQGALMLAFPSLYEGFGIPVLEAMACGLPVVTSSTSSLPEVAGEAAVLVVPEDAEALGDAMVQVAQDHSLRERLIEAGRRRVGEFNWETAGAKTLALYGELIR